MKRRKISILIFSASVALLTLISIQAYWINNITETQKDRFNREVMSALNSAVLQLEKEEAITMVTNKVGAVPNGSMSYDSILAVGDFQINDPFPSDRITIDSSNENRPSDLRIEFIQPPPSDSSIFIVKKTQKRVLRSGGSITSGNQDSLFKEQLKKKATLVNDIVNELAFISINRNLEERINMASIDSVLIRELSNRGITTKAVIDVQDASSGSLLLHPQHEYEEALLETPYRLELFPNDYLLASDTLLIYFPNRGSFILRNLWKVLLVTLFLILVLIGVFYASISTIFRQKKLSKIKNDFINNMTHELKTPISTISLACEALGDGSVELGEDRKRSFINMIRDENSRLAILVENVLKSAVWDSGDMILKNEKVDMHQILQTVNQSFQFQIEKKGGQLTQELKAENTIVQGDPVHLTNVVYNLLDNANKYSKEQPEIKVESSSNSDMFILSVTDHGIGISKENQARIFEKFYRVPTGNLHDVKGFGLGLSYVKNIVDRHKGNIKFKSQLNKGSTFTIQLPINT